MPDGPARAGSEGAGDSADGRSRSPKFVLVALIVLLPTLLVAYLIFGTGQSSRSGPAAPASAAPVIAGGRSATGELLAALDPALGCEDVDQVTIARVGELFTEGHLDPGSIPAPTGAVTCNAGGITRDYVAFGRPEDAESLFESAAVAAGATPAAGPGADCRHFGTAAVVVATCERNPAVLWSARAGGLDGSEVLERLGG